MENNLLSETFGRGWAFPPDFSPDNGVAMTDGENLVKQSMKILFLTQPGERIMREQYGGGMDEFMFENISDDLLSRVRSHIEESVLRYEPRADISDIILRPDPAQPGQLGLQINWRLRGSDIDRRSEGMLALNEGRLRALR